jgi:hypothetical protein
MNPDNNALSGIAMDTSVTAATVIKSYFDAIGGEDKVRSIRDLTVYLTDTTGGTVFRKVNQYKMPDKFLQVVTRLSDNVVTSHIAFNVDTQIVIQHGKRQRYVGAKENAGGKARFKLFPELTFTQTGDTMELDDHYHIVNRSLAYLITVSQPDSIKVKYFYDLKTGLKVLQYADRAHVTHNVYSDYRAIGAGIKIPFSQEDRKDGGSVTYKVTNAEANTNLPDDIFK